MVNVPGCYGSTVCLSNGTVYYKLGQYSRYLNPFALLGNPCVHIHFVVVLILLCFIAVQNTLDVLYYFGKNYSRCPDRNSNTDIVLNCSPGQDWNYNGSIANATDRLLVVEPIPLAPCLVC